MKLDLWARFNEAPMFQSMASLSEYMPVKENISLLFAPQP
jgi:hypothetical protein